MATKFKSRKYWIIFGLLAAFAIAMIWLTPWLISQFGVQEPDGGLDPNEFGDQFGFTNALFTALAFAAFIVTLIMQKDELSAQYQEMKDTTTALEQTMEQTRLQAKTMRMQQFEDMFFSLINRYDALSKNHDSNLKHVYHRFRERLHFLKMDERTLDRADPLDQRFVIDAKARFNRWCGKHERQVVDMDGLSQFEKRKIAFICFDSISPSDLEKLMPTYRMLHTVLNYINDRRNELRDYYHSEDSVGSRQCPRAALTRANADIRFCVQVVHSSMKSSELILYLLLNDFESNIGVDMLFREFHMHHQYQSLGDFDSFLFDNSYAERLDFDLFDPYEH